MLLSCLQSLYKGDTVYLEKLSAGLYFLRFPKSGKIKNGVTVGKKSPTEFNGKGQGEIGTYLWKKTFYCR